MRTIRIVVSGALLLCTVAATGMPVFRTDFLKLAGAKPNSRLASAQCSLCHRPNSTKLNPYGLDLQKAKKAAKASTITAAVLKATAALDSDKDKFTNAREIKADTLPGDPKSKPAK